jgi:hypothetical protein
MDTKGDIPPREEIEPDVAFGEQAQNAVALVDEIIDAGGVAHIYLDSVVGTEDDDEDAAEDYHVHEYNSHRFLDKGLIFFHGEDVDKWVPGYNIGLIERHYE